jgi:hypothetical protein
VRRAWKRLLAERRWIRKLPMGHAVDLLWKWNALLILTGAGLIAMPNTDGPKMRSFSHMLVCLIARRH